MMDASRFLTTLAEISLSMSVVILLLLALGPVLAKRYRARWRYWAWLLVAVRLLLPFNLSLPSAPISLEVPDVGNTMIFTPAPTPLVPVSTAPPVAHTAAPGPVMTPPPARVTPAPAPAPVSESITLAQVLTAVYLAGLLLFWAWYFIGAARLALYCRRWCTPCPDAEIHTALAVAQRRLDLHRCPRVLRCPGLDGPMLSGLFAPALLLPEDGPAPDALPYVFLHELSHYRRRDLWYKLLLLLANAVHWFNPLVWLLRRAAGRDLEQSCDELVLRHLNTEERNAYAQAILTAIRKES